MCLDFYLSVSLSISLSVCLYVTCLPVSLPLSVCLKERLQLHDGLLPVRPLPWTSIKIK
jgi:hypothetical protein